MGINGLFSSVGDALAPAITGAASALDSFGKDALAPAMSEARKALAPAITGAASALDSFGKDKLAPAVVGAVAALDAFGKEQVAPAVSEAGKAMEAFGKEKVAPALMGAGSAVESFGREKVGPALEEAGNAVATFGKEKLVPVAEGAGVWAGDHPFQAATILGSALAFVVAGIVTGPSLWVFGIGGTGVRAGTAAAAVHSWIGNVVAGSAFATAQSAGMGGYGVVIFSTVARVGAVFTGTLSGLLGGSGRKK